MALRRFVRQARGDPTASPHAENPQTKNLRVIISGQFPMEFPTELGIPPLEKLRSTPTKSRFLVRRGLAVPLAGARTAYISYCVYIYIYIHIYV